jgi:hypothetical protein
MALRRFTEAVIAEMEKGAGMLATNRAVDQQRRWAMPSRLHGGVPAPFTIRRNATRASWGSWMDALLTMRAVVGQPQRPSGREHHYGGESVCPRLR